MRNKVEFVDSLEDKKEENIKEETVQESKKQKIQPKEVIAKVKHKVKSVFQKKENRQEKGSITLQDSWKWIKAHKTWFLILIPIFLSIYLRAMPMYLPVTDNWAADSVHQTIRSQIASQSYQKHPNLDDQKRNDYVDKEFQKFLIQNKDDVDKSITQTSAYFKEQMQDADGHTYLLDIDSYVWYGLAKNYVKYGGPGDLYVNGTYYNTLRDGRFNPEVGYNSISYLTAILYKFLSLFSDNISLMYTAFLLPIIFMVLAVIPGYLLAKDIAGELAGFITSMYISFHGSMLVRTITADNDIFNIFFPLLITWCLLRSVRSKGNKKWYWLAASAIVMGSYPSFWKGYWFVYLFGVLVLFAYALYELILDKRKDGITLKSFYPLWSFIIFYLGTALTRSLLSLLNGSPFLMMFKETLKAPFSSIWFVALKDVAIVDIWPNVLTTVAELNSASIGTIIKTFDGKLVLSLSILACVLSVYFMKLDKKDWLIVGGSFFYIWEVISRQEKMGMVFFLASLTVPLAVVILKSWYEKKEYHLAYGLLILVWMCGTIYASTTSLRFLALMGPVFAIGVGVSIAKLSGFVGSWCEENMQIKKEYFLVIGLILAIIMMITPLKEAKAIAEQQIPNFNDAWEKSLNAIKNDADDGIITSWWDFGHWFTAIAERKVTFDGGNQGNRIHWVGQFFLESSEETSVGILKMLNCGQEYSYQKLLEYNPKGKIDTIETLHTLSNEKREDAKKVLLEKGLTDTQAEEVLSLTHCEFLPQYVIASEDMVQKAGVWGHFGSWNFTRAEMYNKVKGQTREVGISLLEQEYKIAKEESQELYQKIQDQSGDEFVASWPGYASGRVSCQVKSNSIQCPYGNNYVGIINASSNEAFIIVGNQGAARPYSLVYADTEGVKELRYNDASNSFSIVLIPTNGGFDSILVSKEHATSLFMKLFFFDGHGLKHFKLISDTKSFMNQRVQVWKVYWEPQDPIKIFQQKESSNNNEG